MMDSWVSNSGAERSKKMPSFHLIPYAALVCLADRLEMGVEKYGENNWQKALSPVDMAFMKDGLNHMQHHLSSLMNGDFEEDNEWGHLGAIMFGCMMRACALEKQGDLNELHLPTKQETEDYELSAIQALTALTAEDTPF